jgi:DinB superfamily
MYFVKLPRGSHAITPETGSSLTSRSRESKAPGMHLGSMESLKKFDLAEVNAVLARTPPTLNALLRGLPDRWVMSNEGRSNDGGDTWSAFDIVGHLIAGERTDWMTRARIIMENGEARAFDPFDRFAQSRESEGKSLEQLLDEFARLRSENLAALQALNLQAEDLARRGTHPALGVVTLSELLATWAVHDLTHLHQLSRVMAHQYRQTVGPWSAYLGVLHCSGHGA